MMVLPPSLLRAHIMKRAVMDDAKRHHPFIAYLLAHGPGLGETQVVRLAWGAATDQAGQRSDIFEVLFVPDALGGGESKDGFINTACLMPGASFVLVFPAQDLLAIKPFQHIGIMGAMPGLERRPDRAQLGYG